VVDLDEPMGSDSLVWLTLAGLPLSARASSEHGYRPRQPVSLGFDRSKAARFDTASEQRL
jgi:multiple sugar transport system ATP-binding protein